MKAIILAGGFGHRLKSVLPNIPKPMAPIRGKPFLAYLLDYLQAQGITQVVLAVHHFRESIRTYFQFRYHGIAISYAEEEEPLGTGGAITHALADMRDRETIFVLNGDTFVKFNYQAMYQQHRDHQAMMTMGLRLVDDCARYGKVMTINHTVVAFKEKGEMGPGFINTGVYLIHPDLFARFNLSKQFSFENDFLHLFVSEIKPQIFISDDYFIDIGIPEDYARAQVELEGS
ncbi:MAG TPA: nucleotidyltransferase family protein [Gammaproteobacteria bacterium]|nr:nucleotidyltransferase family protein [Gammaproteobacteria bacterium]